MNNQELSLELPITNVRTYQKHADSDGELADEL